MTNFQFSPILSEQDDSENYYSELSLEFDDNLDKEKEQFQKDSTTEEDSLLNSVELSDFEISDMSLEQALKQAKQTLIEKEVFTYQNNL